VRVVAGELKGRRLVSPPRKADVRPTSDRVREALFSILGDRVAGAEVLDLFAGTGALGIEALSRGAAHCTFVERDRAAVAAIDENIATLGLRDRSTVIVGEALTTALRIEADLAFADPPYDFDDWPRLLRAISARLVVAEAGAPVDAPADWEQGRTKRYGRTWVTFLHRAVP
jgi:16S rRNA (guanine966-N2)-methyltransferase